jgi:hypothetical protein
MTVQLAQECDAIREAGSAFSGAGASDRRLGSDDLALAAALGTRAGRCAADAKQAASMCRSELARPALEGPVALEKLQRAYRAQLEATVSTCERIAGRAAAIEHLVRRVIDAARGTVRSI